MVKIRNNGGSKYGNFRRPDRKPGRVRWWRWLAVTVAGSLLLAGGLSMAYRFLSHSAWFRVTRIDIEGNNRLSKEQVLELSGLDIHSNLVALSSRQIRDRLAGNAWVASAEVTRYWPNRLQIRIRERKPVAILNRDGQLFYLDRQGSVYASVRPPDDLDFPVIAESDNNRVAGRPETEVRNEALQFLRCASHGNPNLPSQNISEIDINDPDCLVLYLMSRPFPIRLGRGEMKSRYDRLTRVLGGLYRSKEFDSVSYIDADYRDGRILVRLSGGQAS